MSSKFEDLLLLIDTPSASTHDVGQMRSLGLASAVRHARYSRSAGRRPSAHDVASTSTATEPALADTPLHTSQPEHKENGLPMQSSHRDSTDMRSGRTTVARSASDRAASEMLGQSDKPRAPLSAKDIPWALRANRRTSAGCRAQITPERVRQFQAHIRSDDDTSLMTAECKPNTYVPPSNPAAVVHEAWYTTRLILAADPDTDLEPASGSVYRLAVDTGDGSFWFYGSHFRQRIELNLPLDMLAEDEDNHIECDWFDASSQSRQKYSMRAVIPHSAAPVKETTSLTYRDGGALTLVRWPAGPAFDIPLIAPAWDWAQGRPGYLEDHKLRFSRVLARAVDKDTAAQGNDGNLGVAVPGFRAPWYTAGSTDKVTFVDVLNEGVGLVSKPMCLYLRLLVPNGHLLAHANYRVQSFLYYGIGIPCGYLEPVDQQILVPQHTPPLYIFPDLEFRDHFRWWSLRFLSLTLLEPVVDTPNYEIIDPAEWYLKHIAINPSVDGTAKGARVIFDSGSMCTVLPRQVLKAIWTHWFLMEEQRYPNSHTQWLHHNRDFSRHDVLFQFQDYFGTIATLRCSAADFLSSPWAPPAGQPGTMACFVESPTEVGDELDEPWILGVNFFWAALLKLDATHRGERPVPGQSTPYMQLAPQRIVRDGRKVAGPWEIGIHAHLPPRMQATLRQQPELRL